MKDSLKNKVRSGKESAHAQLFDQINTNENTNVDVNENTNVDVNETKKKKFEDMYTRATFYINNDLLSWLKEVCGDEKGEKTRIINEALRAYMKRKRK